MSTSTHQQNKHLAQQATGSNEVTPPDSQVKIGRTYAPRRRFDAAYKQRILLAYNACTNASERGALLRREGLYHSRIATWRHALAKGSLDDKKQSSGKLRTDHLMRENERLKKKLAQAEAIIELQKKVSELFGTHILPQENSEKD